MTINILTAEYQGKTGSTSPTIDSPVTYNSTQKIYLELDVNWEMGRRTIIGPNTGQIGTCMAPVFPTGTEGSEHFSVKITAEIEWELIVHTSGIGSLIAWWELKGKLKPAEYTGRNHSKGCDFYGLPWDPPPLPQWSRNMKYTDIPPGTNPYGTTTGGVADWWNGKEYLPIGLVFALNSNIEFKQYSTGSPILISTENLIIRGYDPSAVTGANSLDAITSPSTGLETVNIITGTTYAYPLTTIIMTRPANFDHPEWRFRDPFNNKQFSFKKQNNDINRGSSSVTVG